MLARNKGGNKALLKNVILEPKKNALRKKRKVERRWRRILDVRHPEKDSGCETSREGGTSVG